MCEFEKDTGGKALTHVCWWSTLKRKKTTKNVNIAICRGVMGG